MFNFFISQTKYILLFFILLSFCSCAKKVDNNRREVVTLKLVSPPDTPLPGEKEGFIRKILKSFNSHYPNINVKLEEVSHQIEDKILIEIAGDVPIDVFFVAPNIIPFFAEKGAILPIDEFVKEKKINLDDYYPLSYLSYMYKRKLYAIAESFSPYVLYYNKRLFDKEGLSYPDSTWNWQTFLKNAIQLTKKDRKGIPIQFGCHCLHYHFICWMFIKQNDGVIFNEDRKKCIINNPNNREAIQFLIDLVQKYKVVPSLIDMDIFGGGQESFMMEKVAMFYAGRWYSDMFRTKKDLNWGIAMLPKGKKRATLVVSHAFAINPKSKNKQESLELVRFIASEEAQRISHITSGDSVPTLKKLANSLEFLANPKFPKEKDNKVYIESLKHGFTPEFSPYILPNQVNKIMDEEIQRAISKGYGSDKILQDVENRINRIIKENISSQYEN